MESGVRTEGDRKEFGGDVLKPVSFEHQSCDDSREEQRREEVEGRGREESVEKQVEDQIRTDALLRTCDTDEETFDSAADSEETVKCKEEVKRYNKHENERKDSADVATKATNSTPVTIIAGNYSVGDQDRKSRPVRSQGGAKTWRPSKPYSSNAKYTGFSAKWGEAVGIYDDKGKPKRVVDLSEVKNYMRLKQNTKQQFQFYFALVDPRFPQVYKVFSDVKQRWRMRYNIFVDGLIKGRSRDSTVHVGEIIIYFDVAKHLSHPFYTNCSFYANYRPLEQSVNSSLLTKMIVRLHDVLTSNLMLQLKFPMTEDAFRNTSNLLMRFRANEADLMVALEKIRRGNRNKFAPNPNNWLTIVDKGKSRGQSHREDRPRNGSRGGRYSGGRRRRQEGRAHDGNRDEGYGASGFDLRDRNHTKPPILQTSRQFVSSSRRFERQSNRIGDQNGGGGQVLRDKASEVNAQRTSDRNQTKNLSKQQTNQKRNRNNEGIDGNESDVVSSGPMRRGRSAERRQPRPKTRFR